ncbi:hypothetical protein A2U01_0105510, partial [Trifolium medium]|nr:hypothetical protein [Trifolium medium]
MPMSEILDKPLVRMPLLHHDVNYPLADLTYGAVANPPSLQEPRSFTKRTTSLSHNMAPNHLLSA